jgi:hypothetical protein
MMDGRAVLATAARKRGAEGPDQAFNGGLRRITLNYGEKTLFAEPKNADRAKQQISLSNVRALSFGEGRKRNAPSPCGR